MTTVAFTAPHHKAAETGLNILQQGGTASEAMVAAAAMIAVQYPHMNSIGGDGFWLICPQGKPPVAIDGCGASAANLPAAHYIDNQIPLPDAGGETSITMAGTISGWDKALSLNAGNLTLNDLLQPAIEAAKDGIIATQSLVDASEKTHPRLADYAEFSKVFLPHGRTIQVGDKITNPVLAKTLSHLATAGLDDFYRGELAESMARELADADSPIALEDFHAHQARVLDPLSVKTSKGTLYNFDAPTQGMASLLILAIYDRLAASATDELSHMHLLVEATKQAFLIRNRVIADGADLAPYLQEDNIAKCAEAISVDKALPWGVPHKEGDTIWMGAMDNEGTMVSFIQSGYWEFGSGVLLPSSGVLWNNRGHGFSLDASHPNVMAPRKRPFHTLNPAYAELADGRRMVYGSMGGDGQPQTQAALFSRYIYQQQSLNDAIAKPRWLLGRTWGDSNNHLRIEQTLFSQYADMLKDMGHEIVAVADNNELMGHAGAIMRTPEGQCEVSSDPRSDGQGLVGESQ